MNKAILVWCAAFAGMPLFAPEEESLKPSHRLTAGLERFDSSAARGHNKYPIAQPVAYGKPDQEF